MSAARKGTVKLALAVPEVVKPYRNITWPFLECRDWGHMWPSGTVELSGGGRYYIEKMTCPRCGVHKVREISKQGDILHTSYSYPKGYLVKTRLTKDVRADFRLALIELILLGKEGDEQINS